MALVRDALTNARARLPAAEARYLLGHVLARDTAWLIAHDDAELDAHALRAFASLVARREAGEPIAYLVGEREFFGHRFQVGTGVLIPRPETELLVEQAIELIRSNYSHGDTAPNYSHGDTAPCVLDLGTGSGCIAISLALACPAAHVTAVDASSAALTQARSNAQTLGAQVELMCSDWFGALAGRRFNLIVSNPPYIALGDPHLDAGDLRFEPPTALASGADGLDAIRHIVALAPGHLMPGGALWVEHGYDQAPAVRALLTAAGFSDVHSRQDLAGIARISGGVWQ